jgi:hypothetical protein
MNSSNRRRAADGKHARTMISVQPGMLMTALVQSGHQHLEDPVELRVVEVGQRGQHSPFRIAADLAGIGDRGQLIRTYHQRP